MTIKDAAVIAWNSLAGYRTRTVLIALATSVGVAAVVILTGVGEGARGYVVGEFLSLGTNLIIILPGKAETAGSAGLMAARTPRDLILEDALALARVPGVRRIAPISVGAADVAYKSRSREVVVVGSTAEFLAVRHMELAQGRFLPVGDPSAIPAVCVLGGTVRQELFGSDSAIGNWVRVGDRRFRVLGVMKIQGETLGMNTDEMVIIPVASAQALFNSPSLFRVLVEANSRTAIPDTQRRLAALIKARHEGEEDVKVITQDAVLATFDRVLLALTLAVAGIASISLAVAGILIMNVMLIAVSQRTTEIGLLKAIGASPRQIRLLFLAEAALLSALGGAAGLLLGELGAWSIRRIYPELPAFAPPWAMLAAPATAILAGIAFTVLPARRAARLDAALALARR